MIREKAKVSYEEAKAALEKNNWDVLDAVIDLERMGKFSETKSAESSFANNDTTGEEEVDFSQQVEPVASSKSNRKKMFSDFKEEFKKIIRKGLDNSFVVRREEKDIIHIPVLLFVIMLLAAFWVIVPLMIVGAVFHFRYAFQGKDLDKEEINETMEKAADYVDGLAQKCC